MMLKIIKNILLFVLCLVVLSGCFTREGTIVGGKVHGGSNSIDGKYKSFTGFATQDMDVKKVKAGHLPLMIKLSKEP